MLSTVKAFTDVANYIKELKNYFSLKNQVLWTGSLSGGQTITVNNLSKYQLVEMFTTYGTFFTNPQSGFVRGIHSDLEGGTTGVNDIALVYGRITGDSFDLIQCCYTSHYPNAQHGVARAMKITKIIGHEPLVPQTLTKLGGGIDTVRRWHYAISKTMLDGYCKLYQNIRQQLAGWRIAHSVGKQFKNHSCRQINGWQYNNFSSTVFRHTICVRTMHILDTAVRFVQYYNIQRFKPSVCNGIFQRLERNIHNYRKLDCNRQGLTSDWGCYCA